MDGSIRNIVYSKIRFAGLIIILMLITCTGFCPDGIPGKDLKARIIRELPEIKHQKDLQDDSAIQSIALFNDFILVIQ